MADYREPEEIAQTKSVMDYFMDGYPDNMRDIYVSGGDIGRRDKYLVVSPPREVILTVMDQYNFSTECTITVRPQVLNTMSIMMIENQIMGCLDFRKVKYVFFRDWSKDGRYHLHGMIRFMDITKRTYVERWISKNIGRIEIKYIQYNESYAGYMVGQYDKNHEKYMDNLKWNYKCMFHDGFDYFFDWYDGRKDDLPFNSI